ncbi:hypothetical protein BY996DRAFT_1849593 [Phakopsora pachyrhizi]|nr:hypothetical protein BY996DRAFT_1849593 [Phakopsora pachyrhizi]
MKAALKNLDKDGLKSKLKGAPKKLLKELESARNKEVKGQYLEVIALISDLPAKNSLEVNDLETVFSVALYDQLGSKLDESRLRLRLPPIPERPPIGSKAQPYSPIQFLPTTQDMKAALKRYYGDGIRMQLEDKSLAREYADKWDFIDRKNMVDSNAVIDLFNDINEEISKVDMSHDGKLLEVVAIIGNSPNKAEAVLESQLASVDFLKELKQGWSQQLLKLHDPSVVQKRIYDFASVLLDDLESKVKKNPHYIKDSHLKKIAAAEGIYQ